MAIRSTRSSINFWMRIALTQRNRRTPHADIVTTRVRGMLRASVRRHRRARRGCLWPYVGWIGFHAAVPCCEVGGQRVAALRWYFSNHPLPNRTGSRVGGRRVTLTGTFPTAPLRTDRDRSRVNQLSSSATSTRVRSLSISDPSPLKRHPTCLPSPCGGLSPPRTTTETPWPWGSRPLGHPAFRRC
jgi:hypothetical protein